MMSESTEATAPKYMVYCVMVASLTSLSLGWIMGSPNVPGEVTHNCPTGNAHLTNPAFPDCLPMSTYSWAFAVASFCIGGFFGGIGSVYFQSKMGRKRTIMLSNAGFIVGSIVIALSVSTTMFIVGRVVVGLSCGMCSMVIPTYIGEISTIRARGAMGCFHPLFVALGIFLTTLIGMFLATVPWWRLCYAFAGVPSLVQIILMVPCTESPRWLISMNKVEKARHALQQLRGNTDVDREFYEMIQGQVGEAAAGSVAKEPLPTKPVDLKSAQQRELARVTSISDQATLVGAQSIKKEQDIAHGSDDDDDEDHESDDEHQRLDTRLPDAKAEQDSGDEDEEQMIGPNAGEKGNCEHGIIHRRPMEQQMSLLALGRDATLRRMTITLLMLHALQQLMGMSAIIYYSTMVFAITFTSPWTIAILATADALINMLLTVVAIALIDRAGRRKLLLASQLGTAVFSIVTFFGIFYHLPALLAVGLLGYVAVYSLGMGPIPWVLTIDMAPTYASTTIGGLATCLHWLINFVMALFFPVLLGAIQGYTFVIFAGIALFALVFTYYYVPETMNRSIEAVLREYETRRR